MMANTTDKDSRLGWARWIILALIGAGLPVAACQRSLYGSVVDIPMLGDVVTTVFYVIVLSCLVVVLALSRPRSE